MVELFDCLMVIFVNNQTINDQTIRNKKITMKTRKIFLYCAVILSLASCQTKDSVTGGGEADLLVYNATIYTVDSAFSIAEAMVIKDGKILATGDTATLLKSYTVKERLDAGGKFIYPGFIDAHARFVGYGSSLQRVNLVGTTSWEEAIAKTKEFTAAKDSLLGNSNSWILGRGWDQNDWTVKEFPTNEKLNELFPDRPVLLTRIDGHAAIANQKALDLAGIKAGDTLTGGSIEDHEGTLTGILIDNAIRLVSSKIPAQSEEEFQKSLLAAQQNCFAVGLTTVDDCGLSAKSVERIKAMHEKGELKMRIYAMLADDKEKANYKYAE